MCRIIFVFPLGITTLMVETFHISVPKMYLPQAQGFGAGLEAVSRVIKGNRRKFLSSHETNSSLIKCTKDAGFYQLTLKYSKPNVKLFLTLRLGKLTLPLGTSIPFAFFLNNLIYRTLLFRLQICNVEPPYRNAAFSLTNNINIG